MPQRALQLLLVATAPPARPCRRCRVPCACARRSTTCTCICSPGCPAAPGTLLAEDAGHPLEAAVVPLAYELAVLGAAEPVWACEGHGGRGAQGGAARPEVHFASAGGGALPAVLAGELREREVALRLRGAWRVVVLPPPAWGAPRFAVAPSAPDVPLARLRAEAGRLAERLAAAVRARAERALHALAPRLLGAAGGVETLTAREREVLATFLDGLTVRTIAQSLFVSPYTVRNHLKNVYEKLGVTSQRQLRELFTHVSRPGRSPARAGTRSAGRRRPAGRRRSRRRWCR